MSESVDTLYRHWMMLRVIPRYPRKIDTGSIQTCLEGDGVVVTRRSIQRDLHKLSRLFPLICDDRHRPHGWSWAADAAGFDLPSMSPQTALTFRLVDDFLTHLMPKSTVSYLSEHLERASNVLAVSTKAHARWPQLVRVVPQGQPQTPPEVSFEVLDAVYRSLLDETQVEVYYRKRGSARVTSMRAHPLGLVAREKVLYLICTLWQYQDIVQLALHRIKRASLLREPRALPPGFDLDDWLASGAMGFLVGERPVLMEARVASNLADGLAEAPLGEDQTLTREAGEDGWYRLRVTIPQTKKLEAWVLGQGALIEVLAPASLREKIMAEVQTLFDRYHKPQLEDSPSSEPG